MNRWKLSDILLNSIDCYQDWEEVVFEDDDIKEKFITAIKTSYNIYGDDNLIKHKNAICDMCLLFTLTYIQEQNLEKINIDTIVDYTMFIITNTFACNQITKSGVEW